MGTNYYFMTKNKAFAHKCFATEMNGYTFDQEYSIVENPYLGYQIHLNKCSFGWRPLFQKHKAFSSWKELEKFYRENWHLLDIYDEYETKYTWDGYKSRIFDHVDVDPIPMRWEYGVDPIDSLFSENPKKRIHLAKCQPEEAEIWTPFDHVAYFNTEHNAKLKWGQNTFGYFPSDLHHWNDPDYPFDWTEGEFS